MGRKNKLTLTRGEGEGEGSSRKKFKGPMDKDNVGGED